MLEKKQGDLNVVVAHAFEEAELWQKAKVKENSLLKNRTEPYSNLPSHWYRPDVGMLKCNLSASWSNEVLMIGWDWIVRDSRGEVLFHARDAFVSSSSLLEAEFHVIEWILLSLGDLRLQDIKVWSVSSTAVSVIQNARKYPRFRGYTNRILHLSQTFKRLK